MNATSQPLSLVNPSWKVPDFHAGSGIRGFSVSSASARSKSSIAVRLSQTWLCQVYEKRVQRSPCIGRKSGKVYSTAAQYFSLGETGIVVPSAM